MTYRFLPWVRQGLASRIGVADDLAPTLPDRARFPVRVHLSTGDVAGNEITVNGPGDVTGIDPRTILRVEPPPSTLDHDPDLFAAIEFDAPDLPWLFTPLAAGAQDRLRPWLVLIVVAEQDGVTLDAGRSLALPRLTIEAPAVPARELPDLAESWAWAHGQVVAAAAPDAVPDHLAAHPHQNLSRLLCPRRLEPDRRYLACLVPAFEAGRLAGLGEPVPAGDTTGPAWPGPAAPASSVVLPVFHHWSFATGESGDFESLARLLTPRQASGSVGGASMFVGDAHPALPKVPAADGGTVTLDSALRTPRTTGGPPAPLPAQLDQYVTALAELVSAPADNAVDGAGTGAEPLAPPIYGGANVRVERLDGGEPAWIGELNRDPRHRAAAGLGAQVVRQNQEAYMDAAWAQVGEVVEANQQLERARLMRRVAERTRRHVDGLSPDALLAVSAPVHRRIAGGADSVQTEVEHSFLPNAVTSAAYRRMAAARSPYLRRARRAAQARSGSGRAAPTTSAIQRLAVGSLRLMHRPTPPTKDEPEPEPQPVPTLGTQPQALRLATIAPLVRTGLDPIPAVTARIGACIRIGARPVTDTFDGVLVRDRRPLDPIMVGPDLSAPLFRDLASIAPDRFLAVADGIPDDTVTLLEPNPEFIEAFLIGANHEMNRELLWRRYPTDRRGTPFRRFWERLDDSTDLPLLHTVAPGTHLGAIAERSATGALTLLIRGHLLRRFPNTLIYATPANADGTASADPAAAVNPVFWSRLDPDLVFVGFDMTRGQVEAGNGWCFVLAEQPSESRFGLDTPVGATTTIATWNDLRWDHVGVEPGGHLGLGASGLLGQARPLAPGAPSATFGRNAAHLAAITMQRPFRAVLHSHDLLAGVDRPDQAPAARLLRLTTQGAE